MIYFEQKNQTQLTNQSVAQSNSIIKQSPCFASKKQRFKQLYEQNITPGPGSYIIPHKDIQRTSKYKININPHQDVQSHHLWLLQNKRFQNINDLKSRNLGPGTYSPKHNSSLQYKNCSFSKNQRFLMKKHATSSLLGPGTHDIQKSQSNNKTKGIISSFKSKSKRMNYLYEKSQIIQNQSKTLNLMNHQSQLQRKIKRDNQLLRNMQLLDVIKNTINQKEQKTNKISYIFKSKKPRFQKIKQTEIGPGYYDSNGKKYLTPKLFFKIKKTEAQIKQINPEVKQQHKKPIPGPNQYNVNYYTIQNSVQKNLKGGFLSQQTRFHFYKPQNSKSTILPGPGSYSHKKYRFIDQELYKKDNFEIKNKFKQPKANSVPFLTSANKDNLMNLSRPSPFGYDSNIYDIKKSVQKNLRHIQKLKRMDVQLPAFNSASKRM